MRFLFYVPTNPTPAGGIAVILDMIDVLNRHGHDAYAVYDQADFSYAHYHVEVPRLWSPRLFKAMPWTRWRRTRTVLHALTGIGRSEPGNAPRCAKWEPRSDDVFILPEFVSHWMPQRLPAEQRIYLLNQNPFPFIGVSTVEPFDRARFAGSLSTSDVCAAVSEMILGAPSARVPLFLSTEFFAFEPDKKLQIAYMPRKRPEQAQVIVNALKAHPLMADVPFVPIHGVSAGEAARLIRESLFFLSFAKTEGFGLPAAEAISTGALTIGFSGVGGDEFFTSDTGFPVPDDNLPALYQTVLDVVGRYKADPSELEAFRHAASTKLQNQYPRAAFERAVIEVFESWAAAPER